jgi:hypothetical protein
MTLGLPSLPVASLMGRITGHGHSRKEFANSVEYGFDNGFHDNFPFGLIFKQ